jgi:hypothetical protein
MPPLVQDDGRYRLLAGLFIVFRPAPHGGRARSPSLSSSSAAGCTGADEAIYRWSER